MSFSLVAKDIVPIKVGAHPPFIDSNAKSQGFASVIVTESFANKGIDTDIEIRSWSEAKFMLDSEKILSFGWQYTRQREKTWVFSKPVYTAKYIFLARKSARFYWTRFDELRPYRIGISHIQTYGSEFDSYVQYLKIDKSVSDYAGIKKLLNNKLDAIVIEQSVAGYLMDYLNDDDKAQLELFPQQVLHEEPYYLICAKFYAKCASYINKFNDGLKLLKSSGRYKTITQE